MRYSDCCGARIWDQETYICSECREHCNDRDGNGIDKRDPDIQRAITCHYPDYNKIKKEYTKPGERSK